MTYVRASSDGIVDPQDIRRALRPETVLVSVMHANNELGTIPPVAEIAAIAHEAGVCMHADGVQALGKIPIDVDALGVDLYSTSGHKIYAPKGTGALYVRRGTRLSAISFGGHHEREKRAGTENVPGAVAFGRAAELSGEHFSGESRRLAELRDRLERSILGRIPHTGVNGNRAARTPNTTNIYFDGIEGEALVIALDLRGFAVSSGAACSSGAVEPSHVLLAIGLTPDRARASIRFSLGRSNTPERKAKGGTGAVRSKAYSEKTVKAPRLRWSRPSRSIRQSRADRARSQGFAFDSVEIDVARVRRATSAYR